MPRDAFANSRSFVPNASSTGDAGLFRLRGVDAEEPNPLTGDGEGVAVGDGGGARKLRVDGVGANQEQEGQTGNESTSMAAPSWARCGDGQAGA